MTYAKLNPTRIVQKPNWRDDSGSSVSDSYLLQYGIYPVIQSQPLFNPDIQNIIVNDISEWIVHDDHVEVTYTLEDIPLEDAKAALKTRITAKRWEVMTGGINLPSGLHVATAIDDQNRITSVVANAELAGLTDADEVDFKAVGGWVRVSIGQIKQMAGAIGQFAQACYSAERTHHEAVDALESLASVLGYDAEAGWP